MIRTLIIEDEAPALEALSKMIEEYLPQLQIVGTASNVEDALAKFKGLNPSLAICDVQIEGGTIFDVLGQLENASCYLIFTTAHEEFAIKAIKFSALDYLIKPIDPKELIAAINNVNQKIISDIEKMKLENLLDSLNQAKNIVLKTTESIYRIEIQNILFCKAEGAYTVFYLADTRKIMVSKALKEYDELLSEHGFIRVHQSYLANLAHIDRFEKKEGGYLVLRPDHHIPVSLRKRDHVMKHLN